MSNWKMVNKKTKKLGLFVYHHDFNSCEYVADVIKNVLGYEYTQASNCAHMITQNGSYLVKTFSAKDKEKADTIVSLFDANEIPVKLLFI